MTEAEAEGEQDSPEAPQTPESPEEPEMPEEDESEGVVEESPEEVDRPEEPDIYDFSEASGYTAGDIEPAYEELGEDAYQIDEEAEKVLIGESTWEDVQGLLSKEEDSSASWSDRVKSYLFDHDTEYAAGGAAGIGTGLFAGFLGYTTAAGLMITGGGAALGWGIGSYLGDKIGDYLSDDEPVEEPEEEEEPEKDIDHELGEYSEWEVEVVDEESYGEAVEEYIQEAQQ